MLLTLLNFIILTQLITAIYSFINIKDTVYDNESGDHASKLSFTVLIYTSILMVIINAFYLWDIVTEKRIILGLAVLAIINSIFIFIDYYYLNVQMKSPPDYNNSLNNLNNNSENTNKSSKELNLIVGSITVVLTSIILAFYVSFYFYSNVIIKRVLQPIIVDKPLKKIKKK
jgi:hypothetical protein